MKLEQLIADLYNAQNALSEYFGVPVSNLVDCRGSKWQESETSVDYVFRGEEFEYSFDLGRGDCKVVKDNYVLFTGLNSFGDTEMYVFDTANKV